MELRHLRSAGAGVSESPGRVRFRGAPVPRRLCRDPSHRLARARKVGLDQVARERLIAFTLADYPEHHAWIADLFAPLNCAPQIVEEHDSATSLIAAVEAARGGALVSQRLECLVGPRLKILPLEPAPPPLVIGIAHRKETNSAAVANFIISAKRAKSGRLRMHLNGLCCNRIHRVCGKS